MKHILIFSIILLSISKLNGQVSIGSSTPRDAAILDVTSSTKGVLFPRVELTSLDSKLPLTGNVQNGTLVFNTKPNGTGANKVFTGFYEWYNNKWAPIFAKSNNSGYGMYGFQILNFSNRKRINRFKFPFYFIIANFFLLYIRPFQLNLRCISFS